MQSNHFTRPRIDPGEQGYIMLIAIFLMALLTISLALAVPNIIKSIQRDRDLETFHRGMQYRRAVQLYYRQFHAYPPNLDALVETNNVRFLRKKYIDPISGKVDWKPILFGQNKTPTAMGFFGQPLAGGATTIAGTGPSGGNLSSGGSGGGILPGGISDIFGGGSSSTTGAPSGTGAAGASSTGAPASGTSGSSTTGSDQSGQSGQTFGGAGIIGFEPVSAKQSILIYKKKDHYNEWEFTYDPISDMQTMGGGNAGAIGQPAGSTTTPVGSSAFGSSSFGSSTFGSPSSTTTSPGATPTPQP
jgi:type II secretory pathway pseudopilin PulG